MRRLVVLAFVSACGLFPDVDALSSGAADATSDVSSDAIADGPDAGDARASPCAAPHTFCDDFDDGSFGAEWTSSPSGGGGALLQSTNAVSPPFALEARVPAGTGPYAYLAKTFAVDAQHVHFECDAMVIGQQSTSMEADFVNISLSPPPSGFVGASFNMEQLNSGSVLEEVAKANGADANAFHDDAFATDFYTWRHLSLDFDFTNATVTAKVDGSTLDVMTMTPPVTSAPVNVCVGMTYTSNPTTQWSVLVDNVVVDLQ